MNLPLSVIMSAHNESAFISESIDSILGQTCADFEFIIIDDGSTDDTRGIISAVDDDRIRLLVNPRNLGLARSLNVGLRECRGRLVARMDANDIADRRRFERQMAAFASDPDLDLVWTGATYVSRSGETLCPKRSPGLQEAVALIRDAPTSIPVGRNHVNHMTVMFRRATVDKVGGYAEHQPWGQDGNLWFRMLQGGAKFHFIEDSLMRIRLLPDSVTARREDRPRQNEFEYYANVCRLNGCYVQALNQVSRMPWSLGKLRLYASTIKQRLVAP